jgi:transposase-like protein
LNNGFNDESRKQAKGGHMAKVLRTGKRINAKAEQAIKEVERDMKSESRWAAIQALIPIGLAAVEDELQREIRERVGPRYSRGGDVKRWGSNPGSVFLGDQKVKLVVPRARNVATNEELSLASYERLQSPQLVDEMSLSRVIHGLSQRNYERASQQVPETFGIKKTSVCRRFIRASAKRLREFMERDLSGYDIVAIFIDGKFLADNEIVIALGVTMAGDKVLLGFVETSTENHVICRQFLNGLKDRGLSFQNEILFVLDGGKGLHKGVREAAGDKAVIQRCQWHKRENVISYLDKKQQQHFRRKLQSAYEQPTYAKAKQRLEGIRRELKLLNQSAAASLDEGLEETLTLHKLGMFEKLGESFKTTNCIEGVNKQLGRHTDRVDRWQNSNQRQRWVAASLLEIEPRLKKVRGHRFLNELRSAMNELAADRRAGKQEKYQVAS